MPPYRLGTRLVPAVFLIYACVMCICSSVALKTTVVWVLRNLDTGIVIHFDI